MAEHDELLAAVEAAIAKHIAPLLDRSGELDRVVRPRDVFAFCGLKPTARDQMAALGKFPKPIPLGERAVGYLASELLAWQRGRIAARANAEVASPPKAEPAAPAPPKVKKVRLRKRQPRD